MSGEAFISLSSRDKDNRAPNVDIILMNTRPRALSMSSEQIYLAWSQVIPAFINRLQKGKGSIYSLEFKE